MEAQKLKSTLGTGGAEPGQSVGAGSSSQQINSLYGVQTPF